MSNTMQAAVIHRYGQASPTLETVSRPALRPTDVLVKIKAASINPVDLKIMAGELKLLLSYQMPLIIGSDFSGEIVAVGAQVTRFQVGDAVYGRPRKNRMGTFAEYLAIDPDDIALKPQNLTFVEAAAIPLVGLTSYQALHDLLHVQPGQRVLIQAGAGGIGTIAIQLAKHLGAQVATTTSSRNFELVRALGADRIIDYHQEDFATVLTDYDAVFDTLGGQSLESAFSVVKPGGQIISISGRPNARFAKAYGLPHWKQTLFRLATRRLSRLERQRDVRYQFLFMSPSGQELTQLTRLIEAGELQPVLDRTFTFQELAQALTYSRNGHAQGKIVVQIA
ncbi:MAG: NADP-dependent oxidoreductase [Levilactobacillus sp.]|jgi:NADPH:quinone reductase-like Zn-dependent oxidoreductase|uniref:NADP-dependent oxidoreductase n=1 Tax=Levilactobacillus sp. TaxID=2767919 RepID=UPI00258818D8|nr:NADP-dependent oxidoreductase [Levilactobacillus sp.]MCI1554356.1 NADP-dependent oxidoreductase [Levilactobacillus sp.]MCI1599263.1 NADP-dependent oxidoreductase [Levilactobacillus sp.]MCI1605739.1 NADP-dependent oxidoreductase [Levilactobacillus sp.]